MLEKGELESCIISLHRMFLVCSVLYLSNLERRLSPCLEGAGFYTIQLKPVDNWSKVSVQTSRKSNSRVATPFSTTWSTHSHSAMPFHSNSGFQAFAPLCFSWTNNPAITGGPLWTHSCGNLVYIWVLYKLFWLRGAPAQPHDLRILSPWSGVLDALLAQGWNYKISWIPDRSMDC